MEVAPAIIECLGGGVEKTGKVVAKLIKGDRNVIRTMRTIQHIVLLEGEPVIRRVLSGTIQSE